MIIIVFPLVLAAIDLFHTSNIDVTRLEFTTPANHTGRTTNFLH